MGYSDDRKTPVSLTSENENTDDILRAHELLSSELRFRIKVPVTAKRCENCNSEECGDCRDFVNRCPRCNSSLDNDFGREFRYCPDCGQALLWNMP